MTGQRPTMLEADKQYFTDMIAAVRAKLNCLPTGSLIKKYFPESRLDAISRKIAATEAKTLQWDYWQPLFLFLRNQSESAIALLDDDLQRVVARSQQSEAKQCEFLKDERERESDGPWIAGLFEVFVKSTLLKSDAVTVDSFDWQLPNGRDMDAKVSMGQRTVCIECTTLGESTASKQNWQVHCETLAATLDQTFLELQDAYTQGRRLYEKVYDKIAPGFDTSKDQLSTDSPNLLLIGFQSPTSDLSSTAPAIGWALDELFASQPTGNSSNVSLQKYLQHNLNKRQISGSLDALLNAPRQISGIVLFDGCRLKLARLNYNTRRDYRMSHEEMAFFERLLSEPAAYCQ